jgi:carboxypeptidase family protein
LKRLSLLFTVLVFTAFAAGLLSRHGFEEAPVFPPVPSPKFEPMAPEEGGTSVLRVQVVDPAGQPLGGAAVSLRSDGVPHWGFTGADGRLKLERLPAVELDVVVLAWPHSPLSVKLTPGVDEVVVSVAPPWPAPPAVPDVIRSTLQGQVALALGGQAEYEVLLQPTEPPEVLGGAVPRRALTDASGAFRFEDLACAHYFVVVLPAWARGSTWPDLALPTEIEHRLGAPPLVVQLVGGAIEGLVVDTSGVPLEGALALATLAQDESKVWPPQVSDATGRFRIADLPPGEYRVSVRAGEGQASAPPLRVEASSVSTAEVPPLELRKRG